jgi:hypothetical protein
MNKFWLDYSIIPDDCMPISSKINSVTRLVIFLFLILLILNFNNSIIFLLFSVIILFYLQRDMSKTTENYAPPGSGSAFYAGPTTDIHTNKTFVSENQALVGPPNPKTLIKPVVIDPIYDITRQASSLNVPTAINRRTAQFLGDSGYYVKGCEREQGIIENYENKNNYRYFGEPSVNVNTACYYNPQNKTYLAPDNVPQGECLRKDTDYNSRIFTQYIQPDVYTRPEVVGFPSSNIGISFQEPLYPVSVTKDRHGTMYTEKDPVTFDESSIIEPDPYEDYPTQDEIYDPRLTGYGSQSRAYIEPKVGQARYMYKDIDAARRGNFFIRSNVDHLPFAQQQGIMSDVINTNVYGATDQAYIDQNSQFRTDIQQRLMAKRNAEMWQLRKYPLRRDMGTCTKNLR